MNPHIDDDDYTLDQELTKSATLDTSSVENDPNFKELLNKMKNCKTVQQQNNFINELKEKLFTEMPAKEKLKSRINFLKSTRKSKK